MLADWVSFGHQLCGGGERQNIQYLGACRLVTIKNLSFCGGNTSGTIQLLRNGQLNPVLENGWPAPFDPTLVLSLLR